MHTYIYSIFSTIYCITLFCERIDINVRESMRAHSTCDGKCVMGEKLYTSHITYILTFCCSFSSHRLSTVTHSIHNKKSLDFHTSVAHDVHLESFVSRVFLMLQNGAAPNFFFSFLLLLFSHFVVS